MSMTRLLAAIVLLACAAPLAWAEEGNDACLDCHGDPAAVKLRKALKDPQGPVASLLLDRDLWSRSKHADLDCVDCHEGAEEYPHPPPRPATPCADCHDEAADAQEKSVHALPRKDGKGPRATCTDCHGAHGILDKEDRNSRFYPLNVYGVCGKCHFSRDPAQLSNQEIYQEKYADDDHAHGILRGGLTVAPTCVTCHGGHDIRPRGDPDSRLARTRVDQLCGSCHVGPLEEYRKSVHYLSADATQHKGATCTDCHKPHDMRPADNKFRTAAAQTCSGCHAERGASFRLSYHGKVTDLGDVAFGQQRVATCDACHGHHAVRRASDPLSTVNPKNLVRTCKQCHEDAHEEFARYMVHAEPSNGAKYPRVHLVYVLMNGLLIGTLILGCLHALLWLIRALAAGDHKVPKPPVAAQRWTRRWPRSYVVYHLWMMITVLTLACTGLPIHFAETQWARDFMGVFGGARIAGFVHRSAAFSLGLLFAVYLGHMGLRLLRDHEKGIFAGGNTLLPRVKDLQDLWGNLRWFLFLAPRPKYDRWTYWEKFDFWAATWGLFIIGLSGLMLWFPEAWTHIVPAWFLNAAVVIHGIEALLDIAFIFTVHVFHANLRPDKFPMDTMFLTGVISEEEFKHDRPTEYERAVREGVLEQFLTARPPSKRKQTVAYVIGTCALAVGFFFIAAMIVALCSQLC